MKIGIDCRLWSESGVGRYVRNLIDELQNLDHKNEYVLFFLPKDRQKFKIQNSKFKVRVADIRWHTIKEQLRFPLILNRENLDLVHFPYVSVPIFYNKPFVVTIHDLIPYHFPTGEASTLPLSLYRLKLLGYKFVISHAAKKAERIITVSNATKEEIIDHLKVSEGKVVVTYEGVCNSSKFKVQSSNLELKIKNYFLYVGNAYPHKNLERLLEAFQTLCHPEFSSGSQSSEIPKQVRNDIKFVLVGKEDYFYKRLKEKAGNMGLEKSVKFLGEVSDKELISLYSNARALILPSLMEGFGLPALEAMANKCLVLASDISSMREICGGAAIYFDPYDVKDMAKKMQTVLLNDSNYFAKNISKGFERARMFSWEKMAEETLKIYESCVGLR